MEVDGPVLGTELHLALRGALREVPHFPISGILFKDISPMLARPAALADAVSAIEPVVAPLGAEAVLAIDARGFILGSALSDRLRFRPGIGTQAGQAAWRSAVVRLHLRVLFEPARGHRWADPIRFEMSGR